MTIEDRQRIKYMLNEATELAASYPEQLSNVEDFILWNLPDEFGLSWIAARDMEIINQLESSGVLPQKLIDAMNDIVDQFDNAFEVSDDESNDVFTHEAMKESIFWTDLRRTAKQIAEELTCILDESPESTQ